MQSPLILASASPRRRELLTQIGVQFTIAPAHIDESLRAGELPEQYVRRMADEKAQHGLRDSAGANLVLGADTAVVLGTQILGKPRDAAHAQQMLMTLSGKTHQVMSAVAITDGKRTEQRLSVSHVTMRTIDTAEANAYWETGEPADKAGAYAIQGYGATFVRELHGSYTGVVGLPLYDTAELLASFGYCVRIGEP